MKKIDYEQIFDFYKKRRVLVTGSTGFKGTWLTKILLKTGATVMGYSLENVEEKNFHEFSKVRTDPKYINVLGDIRDFDSLYRCFKEFKPEIVFHLAAQPIVRESYVDPVYTYSTNVMGTVNLLECIRIIRDECGEPVVRSFLNVTTDKVYLNTERIWGYREDEPLDGFDPYSNSKSCSELVTHSYRNSFFLDGKVAISTARAGNVIGGGDFAIHRIIPDTIKTIEKSILNGEDRAVVKVRNPYSVRPYQHVLEPLFAYLLIAAKQYNDIRFAGSYNVGPDDCDCITTGELVQLFIEKWDMLSKNTIKSGKKISVGWEQVSNIKAPHEAGFLKLDCTKIKTVLGWHPRWHIDECMEELVRFYQIILFKGNIQKEMDREIEKYISIL